jgi:hypothetical protein
MTTTPLLTFPLLTFNSPEYNTMRAARGMMIVMTYMPNAQASGNGRPPKRTATAYSADARLVHEA